MCLDQAQDLRIDRRPDRPRAALGADVHLLPIRRSRMRERRGRAELAQVLDRDDDLEVELLARSRIDELDLAAAGYEPPDLLERPLCRREPDPLDRLFGQRFQALDGNRKVRSTFAAGKIG